MPLFKSKRSPFGSEQNLYESKIVIFIHFRFAAAFMNLMKGE